RPTTPTAWRAQVRPAGPIDPNACGTSPGSSSRPTSRPSSGTTTRCRSTPSASPGSTRPRGSGERRRGARRLLLVAVLVVTALAACTDPDDGSDAADAIGDPLFEAVAHG